MTPMKTIQAFKQGKVQINVYVLYPGEKFHRIFKDLLEDLDEDLRKNPQQRSLQILKDPNFSC